MKIIGWDTETYKGFVKVLTNSEGQFLESSDTIELLNFLFFNSKADYNVFFNIGYDLGSILKPYIQAREKMLRNWELIEEKLERKKDIMKRIGN